MDNSAVFLTTGPEYDGFSSLIYVSSESTDLRTELPQLSWQKTYKKNKFILYPVMVHKNYVNILNYLNLQ